MPPPLTSLSHGAGCGCKIGAEQLAPIVAALPVPKDPRVLASASTADDAGVIRLTDEIALVHTADFFTPIVDDPYAFGRIAATNALSDVYAMGGEPVSALNLVAYPLETLGPHVLSEILRGGLDACEAAGCSVVGGHTIDDPEPKYGLSVTGTVHPDEMLTNAGGRPGDVLVLTKPLGAGTVATAVKRGVAPPGLVERAIEVMTTLNAGGLAAAREAGAHALTDVTGFGLLGHLHELAQASGCAAEVDADAVPALDPAVLSLLEDGVIAGGTRRNRDHAASFTEGDIPWLLCDAMTSGGLLAAVDPGRSMRGRAIGRLVDGPPGRIRVR